jgi:hypothetical protein
MKLVITIDTEEDSWASYSATDNPVTNIEKLIPLQQLFDHYHVRPTYLITYPVATNPRSIEILKSFVDAGKCEIGTHCHPWNTPPFEEEINDTNSMLCNLPEELVHKKLTTLHHTICENFGIIPVSFRSGRWGFSSAVARSLVSLGYKVDTSVSPFVNWSEYQGPDYRDFPLHPYRFHPDDIATPCDDGSLLEVPATVGFLQGNFKRCQQITSAVETSIGRKLRLKGLLHHTGLLCKVWLSPEHADVHAMIRLADQVRAEGCKVLNLTFHSAALKRGLTPFVNDQAGENDFMEKVHKLLEFSRKHSYVSALLKEISLNT